MRCPVVAEAERHHQVGQWRLAQAGQGELTDRPGVTENDLQQAGNTAGGQRHHGVVQDLPGPGVDGAHLVLGQLGAEGREVEEPVPAATDDEAGQEVPQEDVRHPVSREQHSATEGGILQAKLAWWIRSEILHFTVHDDKY